MISREAVLRETKRKTLSFMHNISYKTQSAKIGGLLENYDPVPIVQEKPDKIRTVVFLITRMVRFHGGQTSVLHLGTELEKNGIRVCYLSLKEQSEDEMKLCAGSNLPGYLGKTYRVNRYLAASAKGKIKSPDAVVATSWDTVYFAGKFKNSYKMYFVQDYEPYFYPFGEEYLMCRNTYLKGFHMVSLGNWNRETILRECAAKGEEPKLLIDVISFPYDREGYVYREKDFKAYPEKKKITIAVYLKYYGKRLPNIIPFMLENTKEALKNKGIELEVLYFGEARTFKPKGGRNLGQLTKAELNDLYDRADFGMVASMSNISLVPYEMHAAGLPVIEFKDGSYPYFFGEDTALLTGMGEKDIADLILGAIKDPDGLRALCNRAVLKLKDLGWDRTGREFKEILDS